MHHVQNDFIEQAERFASFYKGVADALSSDQEDDLRFLADVFDTVDEPPGVERAAIATLAGYHHKPGVEVFDWARVDALQNLMCRVAKSDISPKAIDGILPEQDESEVTS